MHFIPTSSSWLNLVERFFAEITGKKIRRYKPEEPYVLTEGGSLQAVARAG
jgi:hypothetical protein